MQPPAPVVRVYLPQALMLLFPDAPSALNLGAASVDEALDALDRRWPGMRERLADTRPAIRKHINIFIDGERATLATRLEAGDEVHILTAISGG
ncbi:MoaD/ThiS family protein [Limibaculum sp. M0105]|uniref:MoaD/ThiS family protein n=1 Tax=Thermohalobaculum xanthum TaxID=2753746 RepID=A0A8J7M5Z2_9RHOB|nr:MoaD/ThiS family protein [Thermohalobaculum xanthum]MBK0398969.1 MoaD/ThiS family protein [Thermohalobaculum xanthum]